MKKVVIILALVLTSSVALVSCRDNKTAEEKIETAIDDISDEVDEASDDVKDAMEDVQDEIDEVKEESKKDDHKS